MKINKLNYEAFMIDYIEGQLTLEERQLMDQFLSEHPDIKAEISMYLEGPLLVEDENVTYTQKAQHLKSTTALTRYLLAFFIIGTALLSIWFMAQPSTKVQDRTNDLVQEALHDLKQNGVLDDSAKKVDLKQLETEQEAASSLLVTEQTQSEVLSKVKNDIEKQVASRVIRSISKKEKPAIQLQSASSVRSSKQVTTPKLIMAEAVPQQTQKELTVSPSDLPVLIAEVLEIESRSLSLSETMQINLTHLDSAESMASEEPKSKRKKWWDLFIPQTYSDVDVGDVFVSATLQDSAEEMDNSVLPLQLITN